MWLWAVHRDAIKEEIFYLLRNCKEGVSWRHSSLMLIPQLGALKPAKMKIFHLNEFPSRILNRTHKQDACIMNFYAPHAEALLLSMKTSRKNKCWIGKIKINWWNFPNFYDSFSSRVLDEPFGLWKEVKLSLPCSRIFIDFLLNVGVLSTFYSIQRWETVLQFGLFDYFAGGKSGGNSAWKAISFHDARFHSTLLGVECRRYKPFVPIAPIPWKFV